MTQSNKPRFDPRSDPAVPPGMSIELLQDLHLLTRDGHLNADARRKLKQIRHFVGLLQNALDDVFARVEQPVVVDCGAGKSYLGFLLYELVLGPRGKGTLLAIESRSELVASGRKRASNFGHERFEFVDGSIATTQQTLPEQVHLVTALHACDTATDDAIALGLAHKADYIAVVPCCQAQVARQLEHVAVDDEACAALFARNLHRREFASHLTNVVRALTLEANGYQVMVTELVGWEHSAKNELIVGKRVNAGNPRAKRQLEDILDRFKIRPACIEPR